MKPPITIEQQANGFYRASSGERYQDDLCWEEALGVAASYLFSPEAECLIGLRTKEQHDAFWRRHDATAHGATSKIARLLPSPAPAPQHNTAQSVPDYVNWSETQDIDSEDD